MSSNITESDTFPTSLQKPDVADTTYPTVVGQFHTDITNRTRHLQNSITWAFGTTNAATFDSEEEALLTSLPHPENRLGVLNFWSQIAKPLVGTIKYISNRVVGLSNTPLIIPMGITPINLGDQANWAFGLISGKAVLRQANASGDEIAHFDIPVPLGGRLRNVTVWALPFTGVTHSAMPAVKPSFTVGQISSQAGGFSSTSIGSVTDPSASTAAYDVLHAISLDTSFAMVQAPPTGALLGYRLAVTGESGANSIGDGFCIAAITLKFSR